MDPVRLGRRIKQLREAAGLSRPELAERAGLDRSDLWRIEQGIGPVNIGLKRLQRIANALRVHITRLFVRSLNRDAPQSHV